MTNTTESSFFRPGVVTTSPAALDVLQECSVPVVEILARHLAGDWPQMEPAERLANYEAVTHQPTLIVGRYVLDSTGLQRVTLITEPDRMTLIVTDHQAQNILAKVTRSSLFSLPAPFAAPGGLAGLRSSSNER